MFYLQTCVTVRVGWDALLLMTPYIEEVEEGPMLGGMKQKSLSHSKVYTYKPRINIHFKTPVLKQDISLRNGRHGFGYPVFATIFYQSLKSMDSFSLNQAVFLEGEDGREALQLLFLVLPPSLKKEHLIVTWGLVGKEVMKDVMNSLV